MIDSLNAEIALGTVANVDDAVKWLGYTYLFVRMRKNPTFYGMSRSSPFPSGLPSNASVSGISYDDLKKDPHLGGRREFHAVTSAKLLSAARMVTYDENNGAFFITDLGRIAAKFYIRHASIEVFNKELRPMMTEGDVLATLSMSTEVSRHHNRHSLRHALTS